MMKQTKEEKRLLEALKKAPKQEQEQYIQMVRKQGNVATLPDLLLLAADAHFQAIQKPVLQLVADLKSQEAVPMLMETLHQPAIAPIKKAYVEALWQNGLDFSDYLSDFVDIIIEGSYPLAIEAFSVLDGTDAVFDSELVKQQVDKLKTAITEEPGEKKLFLKSVIDMLESHTGALGR